MLFVYTVQIKVILLEWNFYESMILQLEKVALILIMLIIKLWLNFLKFIWTFNMESENTSLSLFVHKITQYLNLFSSYNLSSYNWNFRSTMGIVLCHISISLGHVYDRNVKRKPPPQKLKQQ